MYPLNAFKTVELLHLVTVYVCAIAYTNTLVSDNHLTVFPFNCHICVCLYLMVHHSYPLSQLEIILTQTQGFFRGLGL